MRLWLPEILTLALAHCRISASVISFPWEWNLKFFRSCRTLYLIICHNNAEKKRGQHSLFIKRRYIRTQQKNSAKQSEKSFLNSIKSIMAEQSITQNQFFISLYNIISSDIDQGKLQLLPYFYHLVTVFYFPEW